MNEPEKEPWGRGTEVEGRLRPVAPGERIALLDGLRGLALLGILAVNMSSFKAPGVALEILGRSLHEGPVNEAVRIAIQFFAQGKFLPLFAFLFGAGIAMQRERAVAAGRSFAPPHLSRMGLLLFFGLGHALYLWWGDILTLYALFGFAATVFWRFSPSSLLILAVMAAALPLLYGTAVSATLADWTQADKEDWTRFWEDRATTALQIYGEGSWAEITRWRREEFITYNLMSLTSILYVFGVFLAGLAAGKAGLFPRLATDRKLALRMAVAGLAIGLPASLLFVLSDRLADEWSAWGFLLYFGGYMVGGAALSTGYVGLVAAGATRAARSLLWRGLCAAGRMPLTNYLLQSVVATLLFYRYGLGYYGEVGAAAGLALTGAIFTAQMAGSVFWLRHFSYGPLEWLWRRGTYGLFSRKGKNGMN